MAIARLKNAVRARWGEAAPYQLQMAVVGPAECDAVTEKITGDTAEVTVTSNDPQSRGPEQYPFIRDRGQWLLTVNEEDRHLSEQDTAGHQLVGAHHLIDLIETTAKNVEIGKCASTDYVQRQISEGMGSP